MYYQLVHPKEFDFVINPQVIESVTQVMYEIKVRINIEEKDQPVDYLIITPNTDVKNLTIPE